MGKLSAVFGGTNLAEKVANEEALRNAIDDIRRFLNDDSILPVKAMKLRHIKKIIIDMVEIGEIKRNSSRYDVITTYHRELFGVDAPYYTGRTCIIERG